jgi:hypothetical protein
MIHKTKEAKSQAANGLIENKQFTGKEIFLLLIKLEKSV